MPPIFNRLFLFICLLFSASLVAQFEHIDKHALAAPKNLNTNIEALNQYLIRPAKNDLEKTRAFYIWLANNIEYDIKQYKNISSGKESDINYGSSTELIDNEIMEQTLRTKKGVCQGYSLIFAKLCELNNIPNFSISGFSKNLQQEDSQSANHAWNLAFVNQKWRLFDPTWGAGHVVNKEYFEKKYSEKYFDTPPNIMILNHLPTDPIWQLLPQPVSYSNFIINNTTPTLSPQTPIFAYEDSIQKLLSYPKEMQEMISAENAFKFNPKNAEDLGYALNNYAVQCSNKSISLNAAQNCIDQVLAANMQAIEAQKKAVYYTKDATLEKGLGVFYRNHAKFYQDKGYQKLQNNAFNEAINAYTTSLEYLELAKPIFGKNSPEILISEGTSQLNLGFVYSSIANQKTDWKSNFELALTHYEKAKKLLTQANTTAAKEKLQTVEKNIQAVKQNQSVFGSNK